MYDPDRVPRCTLCGGSGTVPDHDGTNRNRCPRCAGSGWEPRHNAPMRPFIASLTAVATAADSERLRFLESFRAHESIMELPSPRASIEAAHIELLAHVHAFTDQIRLAPEKRRPARIRSLCLNIALEAMWASTALAVELAQERERAAQKATTEANNPKDQA